MGAITYQRRNYYTQDHLFLVQYRHWVVEVIELTHVRQHTICRHNQSDGKVHSVQRRPGLIQIC